MKQLKLLLILSITAVSLLGCKENSSKGKTMLPNPAGAICDVLIVIDGESWKGELGRAYKAVLEDDYPYLPQSEPSFKVSRVSKDVFTSTANKFRNLIINKINPENKETKFVIQKDVYASQQVVVNVIAPSTLDAAIYVRENAARLREIFDQTEKDRYAELIKGQSEVELTDAVKEKFGVDLYFPTGYKLRTSQSNFMWISLETAYSSQGLLIFTTPYNSPADLTDKSILANSAYFMQKFVPGPSEGSYMVNESTVPPKFEKLMYKGREWCKIRGFWDVHKDFMGGPYISYSTLIKEKNEVLTLRAYVYSPKKEKRKTLLQTEALIFNLNLDGEKAGKQ